MKSTRRRCWARKTMCHNGAPLGCRSRRAEGLDRTIPSVLVAVFLAFQMLSLLISGCAAPEDATGADMETAKPAQVLPTRGPQATVASPLCPDPQPALVTDLETHQPPSLAQPPARVPFRDSVFGTCLVRVTDRAADLQPSDESRGLKNEYSRAPAFNADGTLILVFGTEFEWYLYDASSLQPVSRLPLEAEPRWDASDPMVLYYSDETRLMSFNAGSGQAALVHDFAGDIPGRSVAAVWTVYEGRPSMDSRYWGLVAEDDDWLPVAFVVYDRLTDEITVRDMVGTPGVEDDVDHVTITPLGTYFLAAFDRACPRGTLGDDANPCGLMVYDRELARGRSLLRIIGHYDVALDSRGREVIVYQDIDSDWISMLDLATGAITPLWPIDFSHTPIGFHFSGLAFERPGWGLVSTYSGGYPDAYTWMDDQIFAVELKPGGRVVRLAHSHSKVDSDQEHDYWAEPHATVNRDFDRVLFTSNWGCSGTEEVDMYMIELPHDWIEQLP